VSNQQAPVRSCCLHPCLQRQCQAAMPTSKQAPTREFVATNSFLPLRRSISSSGTRPGSSWMYLTGSTGGSTRRRDEARSHSQQHQSAGAWSSGAPHSGSISTVSTRQYQVPASLLRVGGHLSLDAAISVAQVYSPPHVPAHRRESLVLKKGLWAGLGWAGNNPTNISHQP
jgi:hypothetical protein